MQVNRPGTGVVVEGSLGLAVLAAEAVDIVEEDILVCEKVVVVFFAPFL